MFKVIINVSIPAALALFGVGLALVARTTLDALGTSFILLALGIGLLRAMPRGNDTSHVVNQLTPYLAVLLFALFLGGVVCLVVAILPWLV